MPAPGPGHLRPGGKRGPARVEDLHRQVRARGGGPALHAGLGGPSAQEGHLAVPQAQGPEEVAGPGQGGLAGGGAAPVPGVDGPGGAVGQEDPPFVQLHRLGGKPEEGLGHGLEGGGARLQHLRGGRGLGAAHEEEAAVLEDQGPVALPGPRQGRAGAEGPRGRVEPFGGGGAGRAARDEDAAPGQEAGLEVRAGLPGRADGPAPPRGGIQPLPEGPHRGHCGIALGRGSDGLGRRLHLGRRLGRQGGAQRDREADRRPLAHPFLLSPRAGRCCPAARARSPRPAPCAPSRRG